MTRHPDEKFDDKIHGALPWVDGNPTRRGIYTVVCSVRNHHWVKYGYRWNGAYWVTPSGNPSGSPIRYLPDSRRDL